MGHVPTSSLEQVRLKFFIYSADKIPMRALSQTVVNLLHLFRKSRDSEEHELSPGDDEFLGYESFHSLHYFTELLEGDDNRLGVIKKPS